MRSLPRPPVSLLMPVVLLLLLAGDVHWQTPAASPANAGAFSGPPVRLGSVSGNQLPVSATAASPEPYRGFQVDLFIETSAGVTLGTVSASTAGMVIPEPNFCTSVVTPPGRPQNRVMGCFTLGMTTTTAAGLFATFTIPASGNGCIQVSLTPPGENATIGTYTISAESTRQTNDLDPAQRAYILAGSGTQADCSSLSPTPTVTPAPSVSPTASPTPTPTRTATPSPSATPTRTFTPTPTRTFTPTPSPTPTPLPLACADVTGDGRVDFADVVTLFFAALFFGLDPRYDVNGDGRVDFGDLFFALFQLGRQCQA